MKHERAWCGCCKKKFYLIRGVLQQHIDRFHPLALCKGSGKLPAQRHAVVAAS